jgi:hypothetical protein
MYPTLVVLFANNMCIKTPQMQMKSQIAQHLVSWLVNKMGKIKMVSLGRFVQTRASGSPISSNAMFLRLSDCLLVLRL